MAATYTSKAALVARWGTDEVTRSADRDPQDGIGERQALVEESPAAEVMV